MEIIYKDNPTVIELTGLADAITDDLSNTATVTITVKDAAGANVAGTAWPVTMAYIQSSEGGYRATLAKTLVLVANTVYYAHIDATQGTLTGHWEIPLKAMARAS